jgi:hypothetical protein
MFWLDLVEQREATVLQQRIGFVGCRCHENEEAVKVVEN